MKILALMGGLLLAHLGLAAPSFDSDLKQLYEDLHRHPELSLHEEKTAERLATELKKAGATVTDHVGGYGVVAVVKNGPGPTLLLRSDADALPVQEDTGKPYASQVKQVMHACGHDVHMTVLVGTLRHLMSHRDQWKGTLVLIVQPAEELGQGALNMLKDGLFKKFPRPDFNLALHVAADLPAGRVAYTPEYALANVDSVDIKVRGEGGHGASPHKTKDPVLLAAELVVALQTIVSRELPPTEPAVITVGSIHGGTQHNVIPNEVALQLTVRSYAPEIRQQILAAIKRISRGVGLMAGLPENKLPEVSVLDAYTPSVYNDPQLTERAARVLAAALGSANVQKVPPVMVGEDFGQYGLQEPKIPGLIYWLGAVDPAVYQDAMKNGKKLPTLHSSTFIPAVAPTVETGIKAMTALTLDILKPGA